MNDFYYLQECFHHFNTVGPFRLLAGKLEYLDSAQNLFSCEGHSCVQSVSKFAKVKFQGIFFACFGCYHFLHLERICP